MSVDLSRLIRRIRRRLRKTFRKHREVVLFFSLFVLAVLSCIWLIFRLGG